MNNQKGLAPILIIILIAVAIIGGYLIYQKQNKTAVVPQVVQPSSVPPSTSSATNSAFSPAPNGVGETANWKTYTNTKYGYTLRYPENLFISESNDPNGNIDTTALSNYDGKDFSSGKKNPDDSDVFLMWIRNPWQGNMSPEKAKSNYKSSTLKVEDYVVGGIKGFKVTGDSIGVNGTQIIIVNNGKEYDFQLRSQNSKFADYFNQILSTFKFLQ